MFSYDVMARKYAGFHIGVDHPRTRLTRELPLASATETLAPCGADKG